MLRIERRHAGAERATATLTLPYDKRQRSRFRAQLDDGCEVAVQLERGSSLKHGDLLDAADGTVVRVQASPESVSVVRSDDVLALSRAAYHLGNRHVPLQIALGELSYAHDHVLDDMVRQLGLNVDLAQRPFEPEPGAYGTGHAHASHGHGHAKGRIHQHHSHKSHDHDHDGEDDHHH